MNERWLTFREAVELVRAHMNASVGRAEAVVKAARASGEVRSDLSRGRDGFLLLTADDGVVDMNMRPGALDKNGVVPKLILSKDDLTDWLSRQPPEKKPAPPSTPSAPRTGRTPAYDWVAVRRVTFELMNHHDEFSVDDPDWNAQARLEEILCEKFGMGISTLRAQLPKFLTEWRKLKVGN
jgi:hypothetical protein